MMPVNRIEDRIRNARTTTNTATNERIIALGEAAMAKRNEQNAAAINAGSGIKRMMMNRYWTKLATAAAVIVAIGLGMYALTGSIDVTSITLAQVQQAMQGIDWMRMVDKTADSGTEGIWYSFASRIEIVCDSESKIVYNDFNAGKTYIWNPGSEVIDESPIDPNRQFAGDMGSPFELLSQLFDTMTPDRGWNTRKEPGTYRDRNVEIWTAHRVIEKNGSSVEETNKIYIDIETKRPVGIAEYEGTKGNLRLKNDVEITYPETGPADIYEAGAPRSVQIKPSPKK